MIEIFVIRARRDAWGIKNRREIAIVGKAL